MALSKGLYNQCHATLLKCSEFDSPEYLRAVFVTAELVVFRDGLPQTASSRDDLVGRTVSFLMDKHLSDGRSALALLVEHLRDLRKEGDALRDELEHLEARLRQERDETTPVGSSLSQMPESGIPSVFPDTSFQQLLADLRMLVGLKRRRDRTGQAPTRCFRLLLCASDDVRDERNQALQVCEQLALDPLLSELITLQVTTSSDLREERKTTRPSSVSIEHEAYESSRLSELDIVVIVLWSHLEPFSPAELAAMNEDPHLTKTKWIYNNALQGSRLTGKPQTIVFRRTSNFALDPATEEFHEQLRHYEQTKSFIDEHLDASESAQCVRLRYSHPPEFTRLFERCLKQSIVQVLKDEAPQFPDTQAGAEATLEVRPLWEGSPFPGLRAFTPRDAPVFFGREHETEALLHRLEENRFVVVAGVSGSGKSSLVWAGVVPRVEGRYLIHRFTPGEVSDDPFMALAVQLAPRLEHKGWNPRKLAAYLVGRPADLDSMCGQACTDSAGGILFFVDQLEELFTLVRLDRRHAFVKMLAGASNAQSFRIVATLRADFYHQCMEWPILAELMEEGQFPFAVPRLGALHAMITKPAAVAGLELEAGLVARILSDIGDEPGGLPLLAYTLDELYRVGERERCLTFLDYEALGGVRGAIGRRAKHVFQDLPGDETDKELVLHQVFRELVEVDRRGVPTRRRASRVSVTRTDLSAALVSAFIDARLLTTDGDGDGAMVEVAHEALLHTWPRLRSWIEATQDDLGLLRQVRNAAYEWEANQRSQGFLWPDERLRPVHLMFERLEPDLDPVVQDFVKSEADRLLKELRDPDLSHRRRGWIGDRLSLIGDPRHGVGVRKLDGDSSHERDGVQIVPDLVWCEVAGGETSLDDNLGEYTLDPFFVTKYPITYAQFQTFIECPSGFSDHSWWEGLPPAYRQQRLASQNALYENYPRENVSWYQAVAFARWLDAVLPASARPVASSSRASSRSDETEEHNSQRPRWEIRLPTEWEWQMAATGGNSSNEYPWGQWDGRKANTTEAGLNRTTAVGMYPSGVAPSGALDMAGNIREWCLNGYSDPANIDIGSSERRVLRGGAFNRDPYYARTAYRSMNVPNSISNSDGFRLVCAPRANLRNREIDSDLRERMS